MRRMKKSFSLLLIFLLSFSTFAYAAPQNGAEEAPALAAVQSEEESVTPTDGNEPAFSDDEKVRVVVELKEESAIEFATKKGVKFSNLSKEEKKALNGKAANAQQKVKQKLADKKVKMNYKNNFSTVMNGFSGEVTYGEIKEIESLPEVKEVYLANEYERPVVEPDMTTSHEFIQSYSAWNTGNYKGEGMVVAIIDSGIDPSHRDMILTKANKADLTLPKVNAAISEHGLPGKFFSDKVPYGYNYFDKNQEIRDLVPGGSNHGMHVGGTVAANGNPDNGGVKGVAPEAQLLAMKVFSNDPNYASTFSDIYIVAIDEAIKLGADVLNMSLGSVASFYSADDPANLAITRAVDNGIVSSVSAGNSRHIGRGYKTPFAENPDIGLVGAPGLSYNSIQVAASGNKQTWYDYSLSLSGNTLDGVGYSGDDWMKKPGNKEYDLVSLGNKPGAAADYAGLDVKGKIVVAMRGGTPGPFIDKAAEAARQGAAGLIVTDAGTGGAILRDLSGFDVPIMLVTKPTGDQLNQLYNAGNTKLTFGLANSQVAPQNGRPTEFSSWGTTPSLDIKPEIMAPGGNIYSTLNDNKYGFMSGTSMAAPHVAGGSALVMEYIKKSPLYKNLPLGQQTRLAKVLLMNTAKLAIGTNDQPYSPRLQGAGMMQIHNATLTPVRVVNPATNEAKVELRDFKNKVIDFKVKAINDSNSAVTYNVNVDVLTDAIQRLASGDVNWSAAVGATGDPHLRGAEPMPGANVTAPATVTVPAGGSVEIPVTIDITNAKIPGYTSTGAKTTFDLKEDIFVEGFVRLTDVNGKNVNLGVPYVGFYGEWDRPSILDGLRHVDSKFFFTDGTGGAPVAGMVDNRGTYIGFDPVTGYADAMSKFALSPNGDGKFDTIVPIMSFLRNAVDMQFNILDENGNKLRTIRNETNVRKHYGSLATRYTYSLTRGWDGKINGELAPEGKYFYEIKARVDMQHRDAKWQTKRIPFVLDTTAPVVISAVYNAAKKQLTWEATDGGGIGLQNFDVKVNGTSAVPSNRVILPTAKSYSLENVEVPEGAKVEVVAIDYANNTSVQEAKVQGSGDTTAPVITINTPGNASIYTSKTIPVSGYATDESGVKEIFVDGNPVAITKVTVGTVDRYNFSTNVTVQNDGVHEFKIKAVDNAGNEIEITRRPVFVDTTPSTVEVNAPATVDLAVTKANLEITVRDNFDSIRMFVNDDEVLFNSGPSSWVAAVPYEKSINHEVSLKEGDNTFTIRAVDLSGQTTTKTVTIKREAKAEEPQPEPVPAPEITSFSVTPNTDVSHKTPVSISAEASESINWTVKIVQPNGSVINLKPQAGKTYKETYTPTANAAKGTYKVIFSGSNDNGQVAEKQASFTIGKK